MAALEAVAGPVSMAVHELEPQEFVESWTGVIDDLLSATDVCS
jgi:hypothetical protein